MRVRPLLALQVLVAAAVLPLGLAMPAGAAELGLRMTSLRTGRLIAEKTVRLAPGEDVRFVRSGVRLPGRAAPVDLVLGVSLEEETADAVSVSLHAMVRAPGAGTPLAWSSRSYRLRRGEAAAFTVDAAGGEAPVEFATRLGDPPGVPAPDAAPAVRITTLVRVIELRKEGPSLIEERRVRLVGPGATEIVLEAPGSVGDGGLLLRLTPVSRDTDETRIELAVESRGRDRVIREETLRLGFDDRVEVRALEGPRGPVLVEIRPER